MDKDQNFTKINMAARAPCTGNQHIIVGHDMILNYLKN